MYKVYCDNLLIYDTNIPTLEIFDANLDLELNKTGGFDFTIYPEHPHYAQLKKLKSIITVYQDGYLLFRGRILNDEQGFYNQKTISCEGELAFLCDSIQRPYDFQTGNLHTTISDLFTFFINRHNVQVDDSHKFIVGNITVSDSNNYIVRADSTYMNTWESINKKLIESYGGYLCVRHEENGNYIDYLTDFSTLGNQTIEFGKNLLDISKVTMGEDIATAIIPLGAKISDDSEERLTIKSVNGGVDYVYNQEAVSKYGWIFKTATWDDVTIPWNLLVKANEALMSAINLLVSIELTAVDLAAINADITAFRMGVYVQVQSKPHSLNSKFLVTRLSIDLTNPKNSSLTLGTTYSTFTEQTSSITKTYDSTIQHISQTVGAIQNDKYEKPITGIPTSDLSTGVQKSLALADTALQKHQSLAAYRTAAEQDVIDGGKMVEPESEGTSGQVLTTDGNGGRSWTSVIAGGGTDTATDNGRFLGYWNCTTGLPVTIPASLPYLYKAGDYYVAGTVATGSISHAITLAGTASQYGMHEGTYSVSFTITNQTASQYTTIPAIGAALGEDGVTATGILHTTDAGDITIVKVIEWEEEDGTKIVALLDDTYQKVALTRTTADTLTDTVSGSVMNYKPDGTSYTGAASVVVETVTVQARDVYCFDGANWVLFQNTNPDLGRYIAVFSQRFTDTQKFQVRDNIGAMAKVAVTAADNGKFLQVVNGEWAATSIPNANGVSF